MNLAVNLFLVENYRLVWGILFFSSHCTDVFIHEPCILILVTGIHCASPLLSVEVALGSSTWLLNDVWNRVLEKRYNEKDG